MAAQRWCAVANPLSAKFDVLRPSLLPGLVDVVAHNRRHGRRDVGLFEIGARFTATGGERRGAGAGVDRRGRAEHWSDDRPDIDFFDAKGVVELLCAALGVTGAVRPRTRPPYLVPGQAAAVVADGVAVGVVGQIAPAIADERGAPQQDRDRRRRARSRALSHGARARRPSAVQPLPRHPFVVRDLSIVVSRYLACGDHSWHHSGGRLRTAPAPLVAHHVFRSLQGQRRARRIGQPLGAADVPGRQTAR